MKIVARIDKPAKLSCYWDVAFVYSIFITIYILNQEIVGNF